MTNIVKTHRTYFCEDGNAYSTREGAKKAMYEKKKAQYDIEMLKAKIAMHEAQEKAQAEAQFRKDIGLTLMENDAKRLHENVVKEQLQLAYVVEMNSSTACIEKAKLRVKNSRAMYNAVVKHIFKVCLKHGVKSEHTKSN